MELVPFDRFRVALIIPASHVGNVWLGLRVQPSDGVGMFLPQNTVPLVLTLGDHGAIVQGPIFAVCPAGPDVMTFWDSSVGPIGE